MSAAPRSARRSTEFSDDDIRDEVSKMLTCVFTSVQPTTVLVHTYGRNHGGTQWPMLMRQLALPSSKPPTPTSKPPTPPSDRSGSRLARDRSDRSDPNRHAIRSSDRSRADARRSRSRSPRTSGRSHVTTTPRGTTPVTSAPADVTSTAVHSVSTTLQSAIDSKLDDIPLRPKPAAPRVDRALDDDSSDASGVSVPVRPC